MLQKDRRQSLKHTMPYLHDKTGMATFFTGQVQTQQLMNSVMQRWKLPILQSKCHINTMALDVHLNKVNSPIKLLSLLYWVKGPAIRDISMY